MVDEWRDCLADAEREATTGDVEGLRVAGAMLTRLRAEFPAGWTLPELDAAAVNPGHCNWSDLGVELDTAAVAAANAAFAAGAARRVQIKEAASGGRRSQYSDLRDRALSEARTIWRGNQSLSRNAVAGALLRRWSGAGVAPLPPVKTVWRWIDGYADGSPLTTLAPK